VRGLGLLGLSLLAHDAGSDVLEQHDHAEYRADNCDSKSRQHG